MKKIHTLLLLFMLTAMVGRAQRYVTEVFSDVTLTSNVIYGANASLILLLDGNPANDLHPLKQPLAMDVYEPAGDTETARPLVLVFHSGSFLPFPANGQTVGTKTDSTAVEICTRLAKMGYVAASVDYRLFWNPQDPDEIDRRSTLINAAYRGVQDARTAIRYFRKTVAEDGNPFGVDPDKITLFGIGTGGYLSLNTAVLDSYSKVLIPKFIIEAAPGVFIPMIIEQVNGDVEGKTVGLVPNGYPIYTPGDTLNYPNWVDYPSDFKLSVNLGGAIGDSSWIDPGQPAGISFHTPTDPFAPYVEGIVVVPILNYNVVEVQGSYLYQKLQNQYGNNDAFANANFNDEYTATANARNDGYEGLYPMPVTDPLNSDPWNFYSPSNPNATTPPDPVAARLYIDTVMNYFAPRACLTLDLGCDLSAYTAIEEVLTDSEVGLNAGPNPAATEVKFTTDAAFPMQSIYVYDLQGRLVKAHTHIAASEFRMNRNSLMAGTYVARVNFREGIVTKKIVFN